MKRMSVSQYANQYMKAKTPWAKASLFVRSLGLRFALNRGQKRLEAQHARNRALRSQDAPTESAGSTNNPHSEPK
jgi:hypothetical protein